MNKFLAEVAADLTAIRVGLAEQRNALLGNGLSFDEAAAEMNNQILHGIAVLIQEISLENDQHLHISVIDKPTKRVWAVADSMPGATRAAVIRACEEMGIAYYTARTQYQSWRTAVKASTKAD